MQGEIREKLIAWVQATRPGALSRLRMGDVQLADVAAPPRRRAT